MDTVFHTDSDQRSATKRSGEDSDPLLITLQIYKVHICSHKERFTERILLLRLWHTGLV